MPRPLLILPLLAAAALAGCAPDEAQVLEAGDCLLIAGVGAEVREVPVVACDQPHEAEVYAVIEVTDTGTFEEAAVVEEVEARCIDEFEAYVGESYSTSRLDIFYRWPLIDAWEAGDHGAMCAVFVPDEAGMPIPFEGTLRGA